MWQRWQSHPEAVAVAYTFENLAQVGDHIVSAKNIYGGTFNFLAHTFTDFGVNTTFVDIFNLEEVEAAIQENTKAIFIETLGNPNSDVVDIEAVAKLAHAHKIPLVVDNTFATPYLVRPIDTEQTSLYILRRNSSAAMAQRSAALS